MRTARVYWLLLVCALVDGDVHFPVKDREPAELAELASLFARHGGRSRKLRVLPRGGLETTGAIAKGELVLVAPDTTALFSFGVKRRLEQAFGRSPRLKVPR